MLKILKNWIPLKGKRRDFPFLLRGMFREKLELDVIKELKLLIKL